MGSILPIIIGVKRYLSGYPNCSSKASDRTCPSNPPAARSLKSRRSSASTARVSFSRSTVTSWFYL